MQNNTNKINFYREIDGLRGYAIILVLLFHFDINFFVGGFIGVDIFFVISGFLITYILKIRFKKKEFSFKNFVEQRSRRLFPALFLMILIVQCFCFFFIDTFIFEDVIKSSFSQVLSVSNLYFWRGTGYFDIGSINKPLLHTWTLSIEQQFYIIIFFTFFYFNKKRIEAKKIIFILFFFFLLSLFISAYSSIHHKSASFYLLPSRLYEFIIGSLIHYLPVIHNIKLLNIISISGAFFLILSLILIDNNSTFPGFLGILPTVSTAILIYSFVNYKDTSISYFFKNYLITFFGKISYSLYLWHWPVWVILNQFKEQIFNISISFQAFVISFIISSISYYFIETPIRQRKVFKKRFWYLILFLIFLITFPQVFKSLRLIFFKFYNPTLYSYIYPQSTRDKSLKKCHDKFLFNMKNKSLCIIGEKKHKPTVLFWGDSFAGFAASGINYALLKNNVSGFQLTRGGCVPLFEEYWEEFRNKDDCSKMRLFAKEFIKINEIKYVLFFANWKNYFKQSDDDSYNKLITSFTKTIAYLSENGIVPIVIETPPIQEKNIPKLLYSRYKEGNISNFGINKSYYLKNQFVYEKKIYEILKKNSGVFIETNDYFCPHSKCLISNNGLSFYYDKTHLSHTGAMFVGELIINRIKSVIK